MLLVYHCFRPVLVIHVADMVILLIWTNPKPGHCVKENMESEQMKIINERWKIHYIIMNERK